MTLEEKYQPGSSNYVALADRYGQEAADYVYAAATSGDTNEVNKALSNVRRGTTGASYPGSESTWWNFGEQLVTDPLAAPLDSLNTALKNSALSFLRNPLVLLALGAGIFFALGGWNWLKKNAQ